MDVCTYFSTICLFKTLGWKDDSVVEVLVKCAHRCIGTRYVGGPCHLSGSCQSWDIGTSRKVGPLDPSMFVLYETAMGYEHTHREDSETDGNGELAHDKRKKSSGIRGATNGGVGGWRISRRRNTIYT